MDRGGRSVVRTGSTGRSADRISVERSSARPRVSATILAGGADWQVIHEDGMAAIDTRYTLQTQDEALISVATRGVRHGRPDVLRRLADGQPVDPAEYYFRVSIQYETGAAGYRWLNRIVAVASAVRLADQVIYDAYALT